MALSSFASRLARIPRKYFCSVRVCRALMTMTSSYVMYFPVQTSTSRDSSMTRSFLAICVDACAVVCASLDLPCAVCVSVVNLVFHTRGFVGIVWLLT